MIRWYPIGYLFLCWFIILGADHERIDQYFKHFNQMQIYTRFLQQHLGIKSSDVHASNSYDHTITGIRLTSDFVCSCINFGTISRSTDTLATGNAISGLVLASYSMLLGFFQIWAQKQEDRTAIGQMKYTDMVVKYPHLVLIEYQIKIMQLLIEMCRHGTLPEQIFGRIYLVATALPGPYERYTKKQAKKLYKKDFNRQAALVNVEPFHGKHPYHRFHHKVSIDWRQLVLDSHKYSTIFTVAFQSPYAELVHNDYNQKLLSIIDAGMHQDHERIQQLCCGQSDLLISMLYDCYYPRIVA